MILARDSGIVSQHTATMRFSVLIVPVVLPVLFWAWYHYHKDSHLPEPPIYLVVAFISGIGAFWLGKALYVGLGYVGLRYDAFALASERLCLVLKCRLMRGKVEWPAIPDQRPA